MKNNNKDPRQEYKEYRRKYQAEWERKKYHTNESYRKRQLKARKTRLENMSVQEKKEYNQKQKMYQRQRYKNMSEKEKATFVKERKSYLKSRRDSNIAEVARENYKKMNSQQKKKFMDKLRRYKKITNEFRTELSKDSQEVRVKTKKSRKK